jgi:hypothetical protein
MYPPPMNYAHSVGNNVMGIQVSIELSLPWLRRVFAHFVIIFSLRISFEVAANKLIDTRFLICDS